MHEIFLTSTIKDADLEKACAVLQGLSWMSARRNVYRVSYFAGPSRPKGLPAIKSIQATQRHGLAWTELHKELSRLSHVFKVVHEVLLDRDFGSGVNVDLNAVAGTVRWEGFPDPPREKGQLTTHRKKIDIPEQKQLLATMASNGQSYQTELVQETYTFIRDNVEFVLSRHYYIPPSPEQPGPTPALPAWSNLTPVDPAKKWMFQVKRDVIEDNNPEKMRQAQKELLDVKTELEPIFTFVPIDRRVLDPRIPLPPTVPGQHP
ncbi:hypothetical protein PFICI_08829 [Pestalotiopsis fici W106-1]|uniref:Mediator of RNA polymerase II transcription subunit 18 n=1 Tax=Pestalotiopsis fici (strain W106-1 / CGMCC3.15140) TaxID=1229662 RepID=W3X1D3_PESFW|nr:uncharacterized protein PFICI_08829 [Pestalotiopsis fici W106-1]ETS78976.1 hypothetical protein PFICI_08829 [Pestalotiopsis fici W106-1]